MNAATLPPFSKEGSLHVMIETPRGSRNKYAYDSESGLFLLKKILPVGMSFPFDFGFVPGTKGEDGDPVDVLVLMDEPGFPGCLVHCALLGVLEAEQTEGRKKERNDRLIVEALTSRRKTSAKELRELDSTLLDEIEAFFVNYNALDEKKFKVVRRLGRQQAMTLIKQATIPR